MIFRTLGELRADLAKRLGFGAAGSAGINAGLLDSFLGDAQSQIFEQFEWRGLIKYDEKITGVSESLYDWAADCDPENVREIAVHDGARWVPMKEGIDWAMRSDDSQKKIPCRFERYAQMEVWPLPDAAYAIRRYYVASPGRFVQDNDRASIDDGLIFLHALANAKAHYRQPDAQTYANQLQARLDRQKAKNRGQSVHRRGEPDGVYMARPRDV